MMKKAVFGSFLFLAGAFLVFSPARDAPSPPAQFVPSAVPKVDQNFGRMPVYFVANQGQMNPHVNFYIQGKDKTLCFSPSGVTFVLSAAGRDGKSGSLFRLEEERDIRAIKSLAGSSSQKFAVKLDFVGANPDVKPVGEEKSQAVISYFRGKPDQWHTGLPTYSKLIYPNLWPGIDLVYYGTVNRLKYEFVVHPGADPGQIRLSYRGASRVELNDQRQLEVTTPAGSFHDDTPTAFQEDEAGARKSVKVAYSIENAISNPSAISYSFKVSDYDVQKTLVIDPFLIIYCGYIGGASSDACHDIRVDKDGYVYIMGSTSSDQTTFPVETGPFLTYSGDDAFVAKINPSGTDLIYCGYIGGTGFDYPIGFGLDDAGCAYISGFTDSTEASFPVIVGPDLFYNGGTQDGFVAKVNPSGTGLVYCGYIGGADYDTGRKLGVDASGAVYVAGTTQSDETTFPVAVGPDLSYNGSVDGFVAKVKSDGTGLVYCGYIGGESSDAAYRIAVDSAGNAYVLGQTRSDETTFPVKVGPGLTFHGGPSLNDAFVAKVSPDGTDLLFCGYIGGAGDEWVGSVSLDALGNVYVVGYTSSNQSDFPVTVGPDLTYNGGKSDIFVAKLNSSGSGFVYCGYIGGNNPNNAEYAYGKTDKAGNLYVVGGTESTEATFPVIGGPDLTYNGGAADGFVAKVNPIGTALTFCGYIGGSGDNDAVSAIDLGEPGTIYVGGYTDSTEASFPVTVGPDLSYNGGARDAFVAKIKFSCQDDLLGTWTGQGVYYRNSDSGAWVKLASSAVKTTAGDLDGDDIDDLLGIWPTQGGVWVKYSTTGQWVKLSSTSDWIGVGDMNGDGRVDLLGTWTGQGVYYRNSLTGAWSKLASPATQIAAGDLDGDGKDDLIGIWPGQPGVWVRYSGAGNWSQVSSTADWIASGDMNGDGKCDILGNWASQGVFYRDSVTKSWVKMASPATMIAAGDLEDDGTEDLIGIWPSQGGVWVKYSKTLGWSKISSTADWISAGRMRTMGAAGGPFMPLGAPVGGQILGVDIYESRFIDLSAEGPGGMNFVSKDERNQSPPLPSYTARRRPGPGEAGFRCLVQPNLVPHEGPANEKQGKDRFIKNRAKSKERN